MTMKKVCSILFGLHAILATSEVVCDKKCSKVLGLVNQERADNGLGPVCINSRLMKAARRHNHYQVSKDVMSHTGSGGSDIGERVKAENYSYKTVAENVAVGMGSAKNVMHGWMNSPGHRKNILSDNIHMGIAYSKRGNYWVQVFGTPQRTGGGCDVEEQYGNGMGIVYAEVEYKGPTCDGLCDAMVDRINRERGSEGRAPLCVSPNLMGAARKVLKKKYLEEKANDKIQEAITDTGYASQTYALSGMSVWLSHGKLTEENIMDMLKQNLPKQRNTFMGDFSQIGIATDSAMENWIMILAATWDPEVDKCDDGRSPAVTEIPEGMIAHGDVHGIARKNKMGARKSRRTTIDVTASPSSKGSRSSKTSTGSRSSSRSKRRRFGSRSYSDRG